MATATNVDWKLPVKYSKTPWMKWMWCIPSIIHQLLWFWIARTKSSSTIWNAIRSCEQKGGRAQQQHRQIAQYIRSEYGDCENFLTYAQLFLALENSSIWNDEFNGVAIMGNIADWKCVFLECPYVCQPQPVFRTWCGFPIRSSW